VGKEHQLVGGQNFKSQYLENSSDTDGSFFVEIHLIHATTYT